MSAEPVRISGYARPDFDVPKTSLRFDLDPEETHVRARFDIMRREGARTENHLRLDGQDLTLVKVSLNGKILAASSGYVVDSEGLTIFDVPDNCSVETEAIIRPVDNRSGLGLFLLDGILATQCETVGFRRLSYGLDRPDVLSVYDVVLSGTAREYPVLLSNGECIAEGWEDGKHWAHWRDWTPKPSYLFGLVAGRLESRKRVYCSSSGHRIALAAWAAPKDIARCDFALDALEAAMRWDEEQWGVECDLSTYNIVGIDGFPTAMENKGLNIFSAQEFAADQLSTTDDEYTSIELTIGHEYFHNLTGNRITVRDWFQKPLKEALTRFRDRSFSQWQGAAEMRRLDFVSALHRNQFAEEDGPGAHAVQPEHFRDLPDFISTTIYDKGAELFRMLQTLVGPDLFRRAMARVVESLDGTAVTLDEFLDCFARQSALDIGQFRNWFHRSGRPKLYVRRVQEPGSTTCTLAISQQTSPTAGDGNPPLRVVPIRIAFRTTDGEKLAGGDEQLIVLSKAEHSFRFPDVPQDAIPSLLRGFSAPVSLESDLTRAELSSLARHDDDAVTRWLSMRTLARETMLAMSRRMGEELPANHDPLLSRTWRDIAHDNATPYGLRAHLMDLPEEPFVSANLPVIDLDGTESARRMLFAEIAGTSPDLVDLYEKSSVVAPYQPAPADMERRRFRRVLLKSMCAGGLSVAVDIAHRQLESADNLTEQVDALSVLVDFDSERERAAETAFAKWRDNGAALVHWFRVQAGSRLPDTADHVGSLLAHPAFDIERPDHVFAIIGSFCRTNRVAFHAKSGAGYALLENLVAVADARAPHRVHWLMPLILEWRRYDAARQTMMRASLERMYARPDASASLRHLIDRAFA